MSAFGGSGGFGNQSAFGQSASAFGGAGFGASSAPFGQSAFGAQSNSLFGTQPNSFSAFGQSSSAFGSSSFGAQSAPAFGSGFGGSSTFGAQSAPAFGSSFGAQSTAAYGASGGFGSDSTLFGSGRPPTGAFGSSALAFGQSQPAWGQSSSGFGGSGTFSSGGGLFGGSAASGGLFGQSAGAFGTAGQPQKGTAGISWQITTEFDGNPGQSSSKYHSITMMQPLRDRSLEELRYEDYAAGNKGGAQPAAGAGLFGGAGQAQSSGLFGSSSGGFGSTGGAFGSSGGAFGGSSGFGAQSQPGGFGQSSGGGLFGGGGGFGATGGFGQSSTGGFGGSGGFGAQSAGGLFGQQSAPAFGAQSGGLFGASGGSAFGSSGGAFGSTNPQSGGLFGGGGGGFGPQQTQSSLFGGSAQTGGGLFGGSNQQSGGGLFSGQSTSTFGGFGGNTGQSNLFGASGAASAPLLGSSNVGQKPLFGQSGATSGFGGAGFGASAPAGGLGSTFGGGLNFAQSAPSTGFGVTGSTFGGQANQQQNAQQGLFGAAGGQVGQPAGVAPGLGVNPSLQGTLASVTQQNGGTVAPPGANYGTVLYNLQKLQNDLGEHKRLLEQQAKINASNAPKPPGTVSVVVMPSPPLVNLSGRNSVMSSGGYGWMGTGSNRTRMRGTAGRLAGVEAKITGTPIPTSSSEKTGDEAAGAPTPASSDVVRSMPFISPEHFSTGPKRKPLRSSRLSTPAVTSNGMLPIPPSSRFRQVEETEADTSDKSRGRGTSAHAHLPPSGKKLSTYVEEIADEDARSHVDRKERRQSADANDTSRRPKNTSPRPTSLTERASGHESGSGVRERENRRASLSPAAQFVWSQQRPSSWSLNRAADSDEQYDPEKYLPYLTRDGFYTVPTMADLASRTMTELQRVEDFTIGRQGYGEITWVEPVDVRGLDLDVVVDINRGEIAVYPEKEAQQLDAPARVKLEGMFKKDRRTGTPTTDAALTAKYRRKLEKFCTDNGLLFIDYDPERGEWSFEAETFSDS